MEYLRVGFAIAIGIGMFVAWCLRPRPRELNDVPPERAVPEAFAMMATHGVAIVLLLTGLVAWFDGRIDRDVLLAHMPRAKDNGYIITAWGFGTFYLLLVLERFLLGPDPPPPAKGDQRP